MKRLIAFLFIVIAGVVLYTVSQRRAAPELPFARVSRQTIADLLTTNGKIEPLEYAAVRAEREGAIERVYVEKGQKVSAGAVIATFDQRDAQADLAAAQSRIQQARLERSALDAGGRAPDLADLDNNIARAQSDLKTAQSNLDSLKRLQAKGAATRQEVTDMETQVNRLQQSIQGLQTRRGALVTPSDKKLADARIHDAEIVAANAERRIQLSTVHSPIDGTVYQIDLRPGVFLNPGDLVASVGRLDRVKAVIYVDEPELGRVQPGLPVAITWDAQPGRRWQGAVDRVSTQVQALGTRQVGEVTCIVDNPDNQLLPGANINAEIRARVVEHALSIPREALRRENGESGVYTLQDGKLAWRRVKVGVSSVTRTEVKEGLNEGDPVALPSDHPMKPDMPVRAVFP